MSEPKEEAWRDGRRRDHMLLEDQMCSYTGLDGEESPDVCLVAGTMIVTEAGEKPIEAIVNGTVVLTRQGWKPVIASGMTCPLADVKSVLFSNGAVLTGTRNHPVFVREKGFTPLDSLVYGDIIVTWKEKQSSSMVSPLRAIRSHQDGIAASIIGLMMRKGNVLSVLTPSTVKYGRRIMALFQKGMKSITSTETPLITLLRTWNASLFKRIVQDMPRQVNTVKGFNGTLQPFGHLAKYGMPHQKDVSGIRNMVRTPGLIVNPSLRRVSNVGKNTSRSLVLRTPVSAQGIASLSGTETINAIVRHGNALHVVQISSLIGTDLLKSARASVAQCCGLALSVATKTALVRYAAKPSVRESQEHKEPVPVSVLGAYDAGKAPVYNLQIKDAHEYYAQGVLVHNCDAVVYGLTELLLDPALTAQDHLDALKRRLEKAREGKQG